MKKLLTFVFCAIFPFGFWQALRAESAAVSRTIAFEQIQDSWFPNENVLERFQPVLRGKMKPAADGDGWECEETAHDQMNGIVWSVNLEQKEPLPIYVSGESLAKDVSDGTPSDYSLYLDLTYADGTPQWGVQVPFQATGQWETQKIRFIPQKPIKRASFYCLFRNRSGSVRFRMPKLLEADSSKASPIAFDGMSVLPNRSLPSPATDRPTFFLRDAAADSDWQILEPGKGTDFELSWNSTPVPDVSDAFFGSIKIRSLKPTERCVTLVAAIPVSEKMTRAFRGLDGAEEISARGEFSETFATKAGMKRMNRMPIQGVGGASKEFWLGMDPAFPAVYRTFFNAFTQQLCIAFDLGFIPEKSEWELRICHFSQPNGGMRRAWSRYQKCYPEAFRVRVPRMGNWMPFAAISKVKDPEDFGFAFKEGNDETSWDDAHGVLTFRYTEPMTWWMRFEPESASSPAPKDRENSPELLELAAKRVQELAEKGDAYAKMWASSVMLDEKQRPVGLWLDTPWCRGIVWSISSIPGIPEPSDFRLKWSESFVQANYGTPKAAGSETGLDGEYVDSSEGYVTAELDFRKDHLPCVETPLTFSLEAKTPAILRGLTTFEYVRGLERDVHASGRLMMANATPIRLSWLVPLLDVLGTETNWNWNGKWTPMAISEMQFKRMLCGGKPYCFLQNTDFTKFSYELSEKFMQRSLAFGMMPGYFSADASTGQYFENPELYERDRPLFKKYLPLCRLVAEAGWQPETGVKVKDSRLLVERFGSPADGAYYLTIFNPESEPVPVEFSYFESALNGTREALTGSSPLGAESVMVLKVTP